MQLRQLSRVCLGWGLSHQTRRRRSFWEGNHISNRAGTSNQHDHAIQAKRNATMRWSPVLKRVKQEAKFSPGRLFGKPQSLEHALLSLAIVDSDGATTKLGAVKHNIVGPCPTLQRRGFKLVKILQNRACKWMVDCCCMVGCDILFKYWKIGNL